MRLTNTTACNLSAYGRRIPGKGTPPLITVIAGSTLEIPDSEWLSLYEEPCREMIKAGNLKVLVAPVTDLTPDEIVKAILNQAGVKANPSESKEGLQAIAQKLDVDLTLVEAEVEDSNKD